MCSSTFPSLHLSSNTYDVVLSILGGATGIDWLSRRWDGARTMRLHMISIEHARTLEDIVCQSHRVPPHVRVVTITVRELEMQKCLITRVLPQMQSMQNLRLRVERLWFVPQLLQLSPLGLSFAEINFASNLDGSLEKLALLTNLQTLSLAAMRPTFRDHIALLDLRPLVFLQRVCLGDIRLGEVRVRQQCRVHIHLNLSCHVGKLDAMHSVTWLQQCSAVIGPSQLPAFLTRPSILCWLDLQIDTFGSHKRPIRLEGQLHEPASAC